MTRLKQLALGGATAALLMGGAVSTSFAVEPLDFTNHLRGASIGIPAGAAPPPGLYSGFESMYGFGNVGLGQEAGVTVDAIVGAIPLVWSTGYNIAGGNLVLAVVQAFYEANAYFTGEVPPLGGFDVAGYFPTVANTTLDASLSWNLGQGWFASLGVAVIVPDGSKATPTSDFTTLNPDYWTVEPHAAVSYLGHNWLFSANFFYDFNGASNGTCCAGFGLSPAGFTGFVNGEEAYIDITMAYKWGKWTFGPVAYIEQQTTADTPGGGLLCPAVVVPGGPCGIQRDIALGGLIGYDFGPVDMQVWVTDSVDYNDTFGGVSVWSRIGFKIWGAEAPKPLVAKN